MTRHPAVVPVVAPQTGHCGLFPWSCLPRRPPKTGELLNRLVTIRTLQAWRHNRETDEAVWQLPQLQAQSRSAVLPRGHQA
ncbi:hypothetical protein [Streptomyces chartreusis]|uniref:hypothetical protein n=1 Tax=Streptomyces chartreusis TaxID=1969 RepID=UPI0036A81343